MYEQVHRQQNTDSISTYTKPQAGAVSNTPPSILTRPYYELDMAKWLQISDALEPTFAEAPGTGFRYTTGRSLHLHKQSIM